jgi:hypothetical protein
VQDSREHDVTQQKRRITQHPQFSGVPISISWYASVKAQDVV